MTMIIRIHKSWSGESWPVLKVVDGGAGVKRVIMVWRQIMGRTIGLKPPVVSGNSSQWVTEIVDFNFHGHFKKKDTSGKN